MLAIVISSFLIFYLFITLGSFVSKVAKLPTGFTEKTLIGLVVSNTITSILSLFFPINIYILAALLICSSFLVNFIKDDLQSLFSILKIKKVIILYSIPFILISFITSLGPPLMYDTGLYHLQAIKWIEEYAVVPGLANLHGRFGFNPNIFTFYALTSLYDLFKQEIYSVNFTIHTVFVFYFVNKIYYIFKHQGITNLLTFNLIVFVTIISLSNNLSSPTPDFISTSFPLFILGSLFNTSNQKEDTFLQCHIPNLILCVYVITVKLTSLPVILLIFFIVIKHRTEGRKLLCVFLLLIIIVLPWLARNIILTGWLVYPFSSIDIFSFDWQVPVSSVIAEKLAITGWARSPGILFRAVAQMNMLEWFPLWWHRIVRTNKILLLLSIISPMIAFIGILIKKIKMDYYTIVIILTSFIGVLFWFVLAPDLRFGKSFIIIAAISPLLYLPNYKPNLVFIVFIIILSFFIAKNNIIYNIYRISYENSKNIIMPKLIKIPSNVEFKTQTIRGINIYIPTNGDRCFYHKIPCTPYFDNTLLLRNNTLQSGFKNLRKP